MYKLISHTIQTLILISLIFSAPSFAGKPFTNNDNVANNGYDVVAYFTSHQAERGSKNNSATHNGATYYFSNSLHKDMFIKSPQSYLPQYDGYCAFAVAKHSAKVNSDPKTFKLSNGKLYLFFNDFFEGTPTNTIVFWNGAEKELHSKAEKNWKTLQSK